MSFGLVVGAGRLSEQPQYGVLGIEAECVRDGTDESARKTVDLPVERAAFETLERSPRDLRRSRELVQRNPAQLALTREITPHRAVGLRGVIAATQRRIFRYSSDFLPHFPSGVCATAALK